MADRFEQAYAAGVVDEEAPPPAAPAGPVPEPAAGLPAGEAVALRGCVLTGEEPLDPGHVVVQDGAIRAVQRTAPDGVRVVETAGVIAPGLIDLHGHPEFNVFAAWEPPRRFDNRYAWRAHELYRRLVRDPQNRLLEALPPWTQLRYAEVRALVGGVTAIQGSGQQATRYQAEALVRNVDKWIFGGQVARSMVDLPTGEDSRASLRRILDGIGAGSVKAFYIHLAEGRRSNERSVQELDKLTDLDALTPATVLIHGTALSDDQLGDVRDAGAKLVWSPQSNLRLYGETTHAGHALAIGLPVALGADWLPTGSTSLLAELRVARRSLVEQTGRDPGARRMVDMVTRDAAAIAGLSGELGTIAPGRPADLAVFERRHEDPWESVASADPSEVQLVLIGGDAAYGAASVVERFVGAEAAASYETLLAWGRPMLLDTRFQARPGGEPPPPLSRLRADLIAHHPQVGPIFG